MHSMEMNCPYLFVYGSLRSGFQHPAYDYIKQYFRLMGPATASAGLYALDKLPVAQPEPGGPQLWGELYVIQHPEEQEWAMAQLDDYEGIEGEEGETPLYAKSQTTVACNNQTYTAWVYWYTGPMAGAIPIPSGDVMQFLQSLSA